MRKLSNALTAAIQGGRNEQDELGGCLHGPDGCQQHLIAATAWCAEVLFIKQGFAQDCAVFCMEFHTGVSVAVQ